MSQPKGLIDRTVGQGRRVVATPEWPAVAGFCLGFLAVVEAILRSRSSGTHVSTAMLLALAVTLPLGLVRVQVVATALALTIATFLTLAMSAPLTGAGLVVLIGTFYVLGRRCSGGTNMLLVVPFVVYAMAAPLGEGTDRALAVLLASAVAAAAGIGNARRTRAQAIVRDASGQVLADTLLENAARGERARIARELHDVVAHHISMIAVQAETARVATPGMPAEGAERLLAIGDTARSALTEMRRLLGVLREDVESGAGRKPQPGLDQLIELVDEARDAAGGGIRLIVHGQVGHLDPGVQLTVYRIVQEALTNARRHARGAAVDVELSYASTELHLWIRDNGLGLRPGRTRARSGSWAVNGSMDGGHGLLGMRERVTAVGGELRAGPTPSGGFLVEASLPGGAEQ